jgi:acetate kinase
MIDLIFNAGSSSLKFSLIEAEREGTLAEGSVDWAAAPGRFCVRRRGQAAVQKELTVRTHADAVAPVLDELETGPSARVRTLAEIRAGLAIDVYVHRLRQTIGAMAATLGGIDGLVFTAGIGEHSPEIRRRACDSLGFLGLELDHAANAQCSPDADVSSPAAKARVLVIATREDVTIVREMRRLI